MCFGDTVELHIDQNRLVIACDRPPRKNWRKPFAAASSLIDKDQDQLFLDAMPQNAFDAEEWTW